MAPSVMIPSMPRLSTPARSQINSPKVAKTSGVAIRSVAAQKHAVSRISSASVMRDADRRCASACLQESARRQDAQSAKRIERQEIAVAGDEAVGLARGGRLQELVVVRVAAGLQYTGYGHP